MHAELREFLADRDEWPRAAEFAAAGKSVLRRMAGRYGGARRWAEELGVDYVERAGGRPRAWDEDRVRRELREFLAGRTRWPTATEFRQAGREPLWNALKRFGGVERWAREAGLGRPDLRADARKVWTDERIEAELAEFLRGRSNWPSVREFKASGRGSLFTALYTYGGVDHWIERMGVARREPSADAA